MAIWDLLKKYAPSILKVGGELIGSQGKSAATNRGATIAATLDRDQNEINSQRVYEDALTNRAKVELERQKTLKAGVGKNIAIENYISAVQAV